MSSPFNSTSKINPKDFFYKTHPFKGEIPKNNDSEEELNVISIHVGREIKRVGASDNLKGLVKVKEVKKKCVIF